MGCLGVDLFAYAHEAELFVETLVVIGVEVDYIVGVVVVEVGFVDFDAEFRGEGEEGDRCLWRRVSFGAEGG